MKKKYFLLTTLLTTLATTSCGYGLNEVYDGIPYNSTVYAENYYRDWDARIVEGGAKSKLTNVITRQLQVEQDKVFEKYSDPVFARIDSDAETLKYDSLDVNERYGTHKKLSNYDNSFRYGAKSKLFDGQMFCYGKYELARCQIDENGFGLIFDKETPYLDYFAMNLKASSDHTTGL